MKVLLEYFLDEGKKEEDNGFYIKEHYLKSCPQLGMILYTKFNKHQNEDIGRSGFGFIVMMVIESELEYEHKIPKLIVEPFHSDCVGNMLGKPLDHFHKKMLPKFKDEFVEFFLKQSTKPNFLWEKSIFY